MCVCSDFFLLKQRKEELQIQKENKNAESEMHRLGSVSRLNALYGKNVFRSWNGFSALVQQSTQTPSGVAFHVLQYLLFDVIGDVTWDEKKKRMRFLYTQSENHYCSHFRPKVPFPLPSSWSHLMWIVIRRKTKVILLGIQI